MPLPLTGPGAYIKAVELLDAAADADVRSLPPGVTVQACHERALVYAVLAAAAAAALSNFGDLPVLDCAAWFKAAGTPRPESDG